VDRFRLADGPYGPGNRGWEYVTAPSTPVRAAAAGTVGFAGSVAGERYVSIDHADGLRSSYSYLATVAVAMGQRVASGQEIGTTGHRFQIGFRRGGVYVDPATVFGLARARLVPDSRLGVRAVSGSGPL
jgi:murein DD-endopeptidase MepM/ murein hydrolase activator NlpD